MAKKKSMGMFVFGTIMKSFIIMLLMIFAGLSSYKLTMKYYEMTDTGTLGGDTLDIVTDATADKVSRNLIYSVDETSKKIDAMLLEVLNTDTGNLDYITIPSNFQFLINNDMYMRLYSAGVDVPQIMKMSQLNKYFEDASSYEYGMILLENYFSIDIGYYTMIPSAEFNTLFAKNNDTGCYEVSDSVITECQAMAGADDIEKYIKSRYENYTSNIKVKSKAKYAETYFNVKPELIYYYVIPGQEENGGYTIDSGEGQNIYNQVLNSTAHTKEQSQVKVISSEKLNIKVLNGSGGDGIAGKVKGILETDGLNVVKIADNPEVIEKTIIKVREEGMGNDLLKYFNGACLEVTETEKGIDIIIIVGSSDVDIEQNKQ